MTDWRLLDLGTCNAFMNMAVDEAIMKARVMDLVPNTVRLYQWSPSAVSIGRFQDVRREVELENCRRLGVDVVRRISGGGTVYHDSTDEITYSVVAKKLDLGSEDIAVVYAKIYSGLVRALGKLGINADFSRGNVKTCPNLTVNEKKISGSAQAHKSGVVLQHGTLLLNVNLRKMFSFIRVPWATTCLQVVKIAEDRITSLTSELNRTISVSEVKDALIKGFEEALSIDLVADGLVKNECLVADDLFGHKYSTDAWNLNSHI